jgi:hypothetical protein
MAEIYNFNNNENEEEYCCPECELSKEFLIYVKDCENDEELFHVLRNLVAESEKLAIIDFLQQEISNNAKILDHLVYGDCEEDE